MNLTTMNVSVTKRSIITPERLFVVAVLALLTLLGVAQDHLTHQSQLRRVLLDRDGAMATSLELMPDGHTLVQAVVQGQPINFIDTATWTITRRIDITGFYAGPEVKCSRDGRFLHLRQQFYIDWSTNKDRAVEQRVIDATTGSVVLQIDAAHDGAWGKDAQFATLSGGEVTFWELPAGKAAKVIRIEGATNSIAISPNGTLIAVSHHPTEQLLGTVPSMRSDKKAVKPALKYREMISLYSLPDGNLLRTIPEIYDVVYDLEFTEQGDRLLVYSAPHSKMQVSTAGRQGYVNQIAIPSGEPLRAGFVSLMNEPSMEVSYDGKLMALASADHGKRRILIHRLEDGEVLHLIDLDARFGEMMRSGEGHDGSVSQHWLPDGRLVIALGKHLGIWQP